MVHLELTDAMVLAAARVSDPCLFAHGLAPLMRDGPNTRKRMADEESRVRRMLDAAFGLATQTDMQEGASLTQTTGTTGKQELPKALQLAKRLRRIDARDSQTNKLLADAAKELTRLQALTAKAAPMRHQASTPAAADPAGPQDEQDNESHDRPRQHS